MAAAKRRSEELEGTEYFDLLVREAESEQTGLEIYLPSSRTLLGDDADEACKTMSQAVEMDIAALVEISSESDSASSHDTSETAREAEDQLREDRVLSHDVYESIIIVEVSPKAKQFPVYKHQLCKESKYFRDLSHCPSNGTGWLAGIIRLPDLDSRIFHFFLYWLYNDVFTTYEDADLVSYPELIELYVLGEKLHVSVLKNVVIDCLASECLVQEKSIPTGFTRRIYHETPEKSPLRRLWVDLYAWKLERIDFEKEEAAGKVDNRFLRDLAKVQMRMIREEELFGRDAEPPFESDIQDYHEADPRDGRCCAREEFEGDERMHRVGSAFESALLKIKLARAEEEMRELRRQLLEALEPPKRRKLIDGLRPA